MQRRQILSLIAAGLATPFILTYQRAAHAVIGAAEYRSRISAMIKGSDPDLVFQQSIASGDPTPTGVMLWTRINPSLSGEDLFFQVAVDGNFNQIVAEGQVAREQIRAQNDYTVKVDLDGQLEANRRYYYRFVYAGTTSRIGRCRTAPPTGSRPDALKLAQITCQDYTNGYYGAFDYIANDDSIDFVVHLGDFIYESAGDPRFQSLPFADRQIVLPSDGIYAMDLADYRHIYRSLRGDPKLRRAMEQHTWIITRDDHETANDCYWDYQRHTLGAPDHPYTEQGNDALQLNQLMLDSQQAWIEYVPARVRVEANSADPHRFLRVYRDFQFGDLLSLYMLDTRTYRSAHACGEDTFGGRYLPTCGSVRDPHITMLGTQQRDWLLNSSLASRSQWRVLGNQTFMGRLGLPAPGGFVPFNGDAWDGYAVERDQLLGEMRSQRVDNLITLTGDLHTYMAAQVKADYGNINPFDSRNFLGAEFMTPSISSSNLINTLGIKRKMALQQKNMDKAKSIGDVIDFFAGSAVYLLNPHIKYFDSSAYGYSTLEFRRSYCEWKAYSVDKNTASGTATRKVKKTLRKYQGWNSLYSWF
ncbi:alkaline phosphatase D family protein [Pseudomarimonas arenosa]|uniref:Alkaline phosphatase D family protein n=1 Tax=Pseudomarimonas arenosa TaxID=2774145 RepID=A0AAW3ZVK8_9GAMM|nr:alkaline phosphatase D family protein [Pseudomarimonas arenosa]MBD8528096.1 alkaline phosphatase D family protein [Pseudomarimonas arenosa]